MFYSHQLLCRKGPLGQIWIAATMHAKINRKRTEEIDIEEICMQILKPQVPLALRLSGILMGGVVLVFHRKVKFLQDDVTEFLLKIKTVMCKKSNDNIISLPKGKSHGKPENLTINYDFDAFEDIERPMMRPSTPKQRSSDREDVRNFRSKEYIIVTKPKDFSREQFDVDLATNVYLGPDHLRADSVDITLDDNNNHSSNGQFDDFGMESLEERLPATDHDPMDLDIFFPEIRLAEEIEPLLSAEAQGNSTESRDQQPDQGPRTDFQNSPLEQEEPVGPESPDQKEDTVTAPAPAPIQKKRTRQARRKLNSVVDDCSEIPSAVFATWLRDREDIVGRGKAKKNNSAALRVERLFRLPSASLSHWTCSPELEPEWTDELLDLWNMDAGAKSRGDCHFRDKRSRKASPLLPDTPIQENHADSKSHSDPSDSQPGGEFHLISPSETLGNVRSGAAEKLEEVPTDNVGGNSKTREALDSVERFRCAQVDGRDYGSVEKLRAALRSPSSGSEDHFGGSQQGLTPSLSGQLGTNASGLRPKRSLSTPGSGKLPFDVEVEASTGGSGRFVRARLASPAIGVGDFPADNYCPAIDIPTPDAFGSSDYFANLRGTLRGSLTQFGLLQETAESVEASGKQDGCLNNVSVTILQWLRQNFKELGARCKEHQSLDGLVQGMDRSEAAKLFYHTLVLSSNNFLEVSQDVPYGDILLSRGVSL